MEEMRVEILYSRNNWNKELKMQIKDKIMRLYGYENINKITIPSWFKKPNEWKMDYYEWFYKATDRFHSEVIINECRTLRDGYTTYLLAKKYGVKYIKVKRIKKRFKIQN